MDRPEFLAWVRSHDFLKASSLASTYMDTGVSALLDEHGPYGFQHFALFVAVLGGTTKESVDEMGGMRQLEEDFGWAFDGEACTVEEWAGGVVEATEPTMSPIISDNLNLAGIARDYVQRHEWLLATAPWIGGDCDSCGDRGRHVYAFDLSHRSSPEPEAPEVPRWSELYEQ